MSAPGKTGRGMAGTAPGKPGGKAVEDVLARLAGGEARLVRAEAGWTLSGPGAGRKRTLSEQCVRRLVADGLLVRAEPGRLKASAAAAAHVRRGESGRGGSGRGGSEGGFAAQHAEIGTAHIDDGSGIAEVRINWAESPVASLAASRNGRDAWLSDVEVDAAERLRRDFEKGQMQPRVTSNWSAAVNTGRRAGGAGDIADAAIAARARLNDALAALGPEFSGIVLDACCFLKGLETIERERRWPARSAKLVLRLGLQALARHYGLAETARGTGGQPIRRWGAADYRPEVS